MLNYTEVANPIHIILCVRIHLSRILNSLYLVFQ